MIKTDGSEFSENIGVFQYLPSFLETQCLRIPKKQKNYYLNLFVLLSCFQVPLILKCCRFHNKQLFYSNWHAT